MLRTSASVVGLVHSSSDWFSLY